KQKHVSDIGQHFTLMVDTIDLVLVKISNRVLRYQALLFVIDTDSPVFWVPTTRIMSCTALFPPH
ncbi:MAG: hypothetical protein ABGX43_04485, partial [Nitrospinaceae bacterium]